MRIVAPSEFHLRWINDKYRLLIEEVARIAFGPDVAVELAAADGQVFDGPIVDDEPEPEPTPASPPPSHPEDGRLVSKYSFDNFVVGQSNRFAHAAAMAIAEQPGGNYNPLFVFGGAGLGKTHLLQAIAQHAHDLHPRLVITYLRPEAFFNQFIEGIRKKRMDEFKARYRGVDILLLDDVQFLEGKEQILEEFFHTFNSLYEAGKQLIFSADRPPKSLSSLEDRIRSRFEWGSPPTSSHRTSRPVLQFCARTPHSHPRRCRKRCSSSSPRGSSTTSASWRERWRGSPRTQPSHTSQSISRWRRTCSGSRPRPHGGSNQSRAHPRRHRRVLRGVDRRTRGAQPEATPRQGAAGLDVPLSRTHRSLPAQDRGVVRRPRPHDGHPRGDHRRQADEDRPDALRSCHSPVAKSEENLVNRPRRGGNPGRCG